MSTRVLSIDPGRKNLAMCLLRAGAHPLGQHDAIQQWKVLDIREPSCQSLRAALDGAGVGDWLRGGQVDEVVIERQPLKNPSMKRVEHYLEMYCAMNSVPAVTQDPKHKLAFAANTPWWPTAAALDGAWTYHKRKKLSVATAAAFLQECPQDAEPAATFAATKKRDDLSDCLMQAMAYAHHVRAAETARVTARATPARVVARKPSEKRLRSYALTKSGVKWLLKSRAALGTRPAFDAALASDQRLAAVVDRLFGGANGAFESLTL